MSDELTPAELPGPSCEGCGHLIGVHSHEAGCMDSMVDGLLERDRLGFCPCTVSSIDLVRDAIVAARVTELRDAIDFAHGERRQIWDEGDRVDEQMTLVQHWSATAGWLASRIRDYERGLEPNWPDAARTGAPA